MQRVRMSLPNYKAFGWEAEIVVVDPVFTDMNRDELLSESVPQDVKIHRVKAFNKKWTGKLGLGSIALRSLLFYRRQINHLLKNGGYDLIYFSTTQFPVCTLGAYWKKRFKVPYVIDMQDPWHSDYYKNKPKHEQPPKYWFSYRLNKYLEPIAMKKVDGLIAVSEQYILDLKERYPVIANIPASTIPFGAFEPDVQIATAHQAQFRNLLAEGYINIVYIGRGGADMQRAITPLFKALHAGLSSNPGLFNKFRFYFIGTSYAPSGQGKPTILPLAQLYGVERLVVEITDRISYYHTLATLQKANALFIPGSDDPKYSASKIFPYLLTKKPLLAIFNRQSPVMAMLHEFGAKYAYDYQSVQQEWVVDFLENVANGTLVKTSYNPAALQKYSAFEMTRSQCLLFDAVLERK